MATASNPSRDIINWQDCVGEFIQVGGWAYEDGTNIVAGLDLGFYNGSPWGGEQYGSHVDWYMELQRWDGYNRTWHTIGTRSGYVEKFSPSKRTFTGIKRTPWELRVKVRCMLDCKEDRYLYMDGLYIK